MTARRRSAPALPAEVAPPLDLARVRMLGVDHGTHDAGFALYHKVGGRDVLECSRQVHLPDKLTFGGRLCVLEDELIVVIIAWRPTHMATEQPINYAEHRISPTVAQGYGITHRVAHKMGLEPVGEVNPTAAKSAIAGDGKATKEGVRTAVRWRFGIDLQEDEADAAAVAVAAFGFLERGQWPLGPQRSKGRATPRKAATEAEAAIKPWMPPQLRAAIRAQADAARAGRRDR